MKNNARCLADLENGQSTIIREVAEAGAISRRLMDLGFLPGTHVKSLCRAPFGDPIVFLVRGYRIGLRCSEAAVITIDP